MKLYASGSASLWTVLAVVLLASVWVLFAPAQIGGRASYVIVNGNSMEPVYHRGDLVIVSTAQDYGVGDIITYRHPDIGQIIHRIVEENDGGRFVTKGDNNSWLDPYLPSQADIVGKSWIHVPSAGKLIGWLKSPVGLAILIGAMGVLAMTSFEPTDNKDTGRRPRFRRPQAADNGGPSSDSPGRSSGGGPLPLLALVMVVSLLLGVLAFTRPASHTAYDDVAYKQEGEFAYSADVPAGVYDTTEARTGEPVFRRLTETVGVRFDYKLASDLPTDGVEGTYKLAAEVSADNGWKRRIPIEPTTSFTGGEFTVQANLELSAVQRAIDKLEKKTGFSNARYALSVVPEVSAKGKLAGQELDDGFSPSVDFWLDSLQLQLQNPIDDAGAEASEPSEEGADPLKPSEEGTIKLPRTEPSSMSLMIFDLGVPTARKVSLLGFALSLGGLLWFGVPMLRASRGTEPARIRSQYAPLLVSMRAGDQEPEGRMFEVATFEDLVKIAEKGGQSILQRTNGGTHDYYVPDAGVMYHYRIVDSETEASAPATETPG